MLQKLTNVLKDYTTVSPENINEQTNIKYDLGLDSLQFLTISVVIEDAFDVEISDKDAATLETVGDLLQLIEKLS